MQAEYNEQAEQLALVEDIKRYAQMSGLILLTEDVQRKIQGRGMYRPAWDDCNWDAWKAVIQSVEGSAAEREKRIRYNANQFKLADEEYNHYGTDAECRRLAENIEAAKQKKYDAAVDRKLLARKQGVSLIYWYGRAELCAWVDNEVKQQKELKERNAQQEKNRQAIREQDAKSHAERTQQESERASQVALSALDRYKKGELKLSDISRDWKSCISHYTRDMHDKAPDFLILISIATVMKKDQFEGCLDIKSTDVKVAQWFSAQRTPLKVIGVTTADDFQSIVASRGNYLDSLSFERLELPCETLLTSLSANTCGATVKYNCTTNKYDVYFRPHSAPVLNIDASEITHIRAEAPKSIQTLIDRFSPNADFEVVFTTRTFNPPIAWNNPRLKRVVIESSKLTHEHVECLKQAAAAGVAVTLRDCSVWVDTKAKEMEIIFMICALAETYPQKFDIQSRLFNNARGDFSTPSTQLPTLVSRMESNDLRFDDLKDEKLWAMILATAKLGISPLCKREAFQYMSAIAAVLTNPSQVTIVTPFDLYAVQWVLAQTDRQVTVNGLADPNHFTAIQSILVQAPAKRKNITFKNIACAPEVFVPFVQGDNVDVEYNAKAGESGLSIAPRAILPNEKGATFSIFKMRGVCDVAQWNFMLTLMRANPSAVRVYFDYNNLRPEFDLTCPAVSHISFRGQVFIDAHLDALEKIPEGQLRTMSLDENCFYFTHEIGTRFFKFIHSRKIEMESLPQRLRDGYRAYCEEQERICLKQQEDLKRNNLVRELIEKYKADTLTYTELLKLESHFAVKEVMSDSNAESADIDRETLAELNAIVSAYENGRVNKCHDDFFVDNRIPVQAVSWLYRKQPGLTRIIVHGDLSRPENLARLNQLTSSLTGPFTLVFDKKNCAFVSGVNLSSINLVGLELKGQTLSAESVITLGKTTELRSVVMSGCEFGTTIAEADANRTGCVQAVLGNNFLTNLTMDGCGLVKKHLDFVSAYLTTHRGLRVVSLENNAFRQYEDAEYKSWLDFYKTLEVLAKLPLQEAFEKLCNMVNVMHDSGREQPNPMRTNIDTYLTPFYVCANRIAFSDVTQCRKQINALVEALELRDRLQPEDVRAVLQRVVDSAAQSNECNVGVLLYLPNIVRRHGLKDEGICSALFKQVESVLLTHERELESQEMLPLCDETSIKDILKNLFETEVALTQLRLLNRQTEKEESRFCEFAKILTRFYVKNDKKLGCEDDLLLMLFNMLERNKDKVLAREVEQLVLKMQQQHVMREMKANGNKLSKPQQTLLADVEKQTTLEGLMSLLNTNLKVFPGKVSKEIEKMIKLPLMRQLIARFAAVKNSPDRQRRNSMELQRSAAVEPRKGAGFYPEVTESGAIIPTAVNVAPSLQDLKQDDLDNKYALFGTAKQPVTEEAVANPNDQIEAVPAPSAPPAPVSNENAVNAAPQYQPQPAGFVALPDAYHAAPVLAVYGAQPVMQYPPQVGEGRLAANVRGYGASVLHAAVPRGVAPAPAPAEPQEEIVLPDVPNRPVRQGEVVKNAATKKVAVMERK
ncbi:MAG TPA: hypothetical protein VGV92_04995 [Gammaproteobacteria bacterium]|nr:hypothetical protein [Gammaproteobacteria bacterium]